MTPTVIASVSEAIHTGDGHSVQGAATLGVGYLHGFLMLGIAAIAGGLVGAVLIDPTTDRT